MNALFSCCISTMAPLVECLLNSVESGCSQQLPKLSNTFQISDSHGSKLSGAELGNRIQALRNDHPFAALDVLEGTEIAGCRRHGHQESV